MVFGKLEWLFKSLRCSFLFLVLEIRILNNLFPCDIHISEYS